MRPCHVSTLQWWWIPQSADIYCQTKTKTKIKTKIKTKTKKKRGWKNATLSNGIGVAVVVDPAKC